EDIKNVINLEDISEKEIQAEIESYIVTDGLAREYAGFVDTFTSNILETGVWISGFYGSGKSYFGKLLGYLISNRNINGTPARERILQRFTGVNDEALIKNSLSRLNSVNSRVVFLDVAQQDTSKGFSYTLYKNLLKSLGFPENEHGIFLFQLMLSEGKTDIQDFVFDATGLDWNDIRTSSFKYAKAIKELYIKKGNTDADYDNLLTTIRRDIDQFSSSRLQEELTNYFSVAKDEKVVFLFDEASEAINQKKITVLDLQAISESLSSLGGKVWTIAIAQEKLDDVINNSNVSKAQLTKVTDRFKTKIHLEATEVDVIIRNRLLKKTETGIQKLTEHFSKNSGKISDHAAIHGAGISKTDSATNYTTYYPFYKYQFDLLQNFLFGTKGYASTKVAARGMIITTYDILKQEVQHTDLFHTVTGWHIAKEGQPQPPVRLVSRYDNAERILLEAGSPISGRRLLETINFLTEAEVTPSSLPNITKSFISDPDEQFKVQDDIIKALDLLTEAKVLLDTNKTYRITSDIEQRLLDEMNGFTVQGFVKKKQLVTAYKGANITKSIAKVTDNGLPFDFYITTDNDDELTTPNLKYLKVKVKSVYNISDDRAADIDALKVQHQNDKDLLWLVPDNNHFKELDRLIDEVERITYLEQKYNNPNSDEGKILISFSTAKGEKQNRIKDLVDESLINATAVYLYNTLQLNKDNWQTTLQAQQKNIIQNVYSKRLASQLGDSVAAAVIKEANNGRLQQYFTGSDFAFFDAQGNFIGENLKVSEEILYKVRNTFVDGATLEKDLEQPPAGFTFGTVISSVAALMRAGKLIAKYNGAEKFSWRDEGVLNIFNTAREFRKASFKAVSKSLSALQKQELAQFLLDLEVEKYIGRKVDYNTNDFELVAAVRDTAKHFADKVTTLRNSEKEFDKLFPQADSNASYLGGFTGAVSEANYIDKAVEFLSAKDDFLKALQEIEKVEKFIRNNLSKVKEWKIFVTAVQDELTKAAKTNASIQQLKNDFESHLNGDVIKNFASLQQAAQKTKDEYHQLFSSAMQDCAAKYTEIETLTGGLIKEIEKLPSGLNDIAFNKASALSQYAKQRTVATVFIDFDVKDKQSRFTYSEVLSFIDLYSSRKTEIEILRAGLIKEKAPEPQPGTPPTPTVKKYAVKMPNTKMKVAEYKSWLHSELQKLASASDNDEIEIN
ncbi:MAG: BREX system P-loop protein BrxC, partial [Candidatus Cloacimonetes bacterium]|nr:BREX system P-loop protein BrxC [Candidatus Cloacimonadota bacterium]